MTVAARGGRPTTTVPVLLLGDHISALAVLRALTRRGLDVFGADETSDVITRSRWYRPASRRIPPTSDGDALARYLAGLEYERAVLIPCSDTWATAVAGLPASLRARFPASIAAPDVMEQFTDKARFRALVERLGIASPQTIPISSPADLDLASDAQLDHGFLKPTDSNRYHRLKGVKGVFPGSREEAARLIDEGLASGIHFLLQEWIPGKPTATVLIDGFVDRLGVTRALVARRRIRMDPPRLANNASCVTIALGEVPDAVNAIAQLLEAVQYRGIFNVEFKFDARDGRFKIIELNARAYWHIGLVARAGIDFMWMSYLDALEQPVPQATSYELGRYGVYGVPDGAAIARAIASGRRPEGPILRPWLTGTHALFSLVDPVPGILDVAHAARRRLGFH